jgi:hypothetical protein
MKRHHGWASFVILTVACTAPPGFEPPNDGGPTPDASAIMAACTALATANCAKLESCSSVLLQVRYGSVETCQTRFSESCATGLEAPSTGNNSNRVEACVQAYSAWSCADYLGTVTPSACAQVSGALPNGAPCAFPAQCSTGFCGVSPNTACGTCATPPKIGDSCADLTSCGPGLVCFQGSKVCGTFATLGDTCSDDAPCAAHLSCIGASSAKGTLGKCQASVAVAGAACDPTLLTGPGCDYDRSLTCNSQSRECAPLTISPAAGPCDSNNHQFAACAASGTCSTTQVDATGVCVAAAADGKACTTSGMGPVCLPPARCIVTSGGSESGTCQMNDSTACK